MKWAMLLLVVAVGAAMAEEQQQEAEEQQEGRLLCKYEVLDKNQKMSYKEYYKY